MESKKQDQANSCSRPSEGTCPLGSRPENPLWCKFCSVGNDEAESLESKLIQDIASYQENSGKDNLEFQRARRRLQIHVEEGLREAIECFSNKA